MKTENSTSSKQCVLVNLAIFCDTNVNLSEWNISHVCRRIMKTFFRGPEFNAASSAEQTELHLF